MKPINSLPKGNRTSQSQLMGVTGSAQPQKMGESNMVPDLSFNPQVREINQMKTANQMTAYAAAKDLSSQSRTDMSGSNLGYGLTLG